VPRNSNSARFPLLFYTLVSSHSFSHHHPNPPRFPKGETLDTLPLLRSFFTFSLFLCSFSFLSAFLLSSLDTMAPGATRVARPLPDLMTLSSVTDDTIVTRLRERVSVDAPWSHIGNSIFLYVNRFNGEADQFPAANESTDGEPGLEEISTRIARFMPLEGNNDQSILLL
jgi:hypothetical protein